MEKYSHVFWKKTVFLKLLIALVTGIVIYSELKIPVHLSWYLLAVSCLVFTGYFFIPIFYRDKFSRVNGILVFVLFFSAGAILAYEKDIRHHKNWLGKLYSPGDKLIVTIDEPLVEKTNSFKANAYTDFILRSDSVIPLKGTIILYLKKDAQLKMLNYGSVILFKKPLQEIKNSGNPGGFNYKQYCLFKGVTHQVYLEPGSYEILPVKEQQRFTAFINSTRSKILGILRQNIQSPKERGLAEALLIGYKDNLDQTLVQSYTNTGVVHLIAISGLHLGLIYWLLSLLFKPLKRKKKENWFYASFIISGLWLFAFLAGAHPSVMRSALMFSFIVIGETLSRRSSIYNTLAASAFVLLCINPYWLWDVGFQLSYAAVISIVTFMRPVYNLFYIKNRFLDFCWKINSVTIAAQILTVPLSIYHFHQFPTLFLLTNFIGVPLASVILISEILLCSFAFFPAIASLLGKIITFLIWIMNTYIEKVEQIPFSLWDRLTISLWQTLLLFIMISFFAWWLLEKDKKALIPGLLALFAFTALRSYSILMANQQQAIIVYNVPRKTAIDFISGRKYFFVGDAELLKNDFARNFHLKPSRIIHRMPGNPEIMRSDNTSGFFSFKNKHILLANKPLLFSPSINKPIIDLLIIAKNPSLQLKNIAAAVDIRQVVIDGSVPAWKARVLERDCDSLKIQCHDVAAKGAFVMNF